jgi:hypothetical protein
LDDGVKLNPTRSQAGRQFPQFSDFWCKHSTVTISTPKRRPRLSDLRDAPPRLGIDRVKLERKLAQATRQAGWNPRPRSLEGASTPVNETDPRERGRHIYGRNA